MTTHEDIERGLWDLTACCRYYQTGACSHTEAQYDDLDATAIFGPTPTLDQQAWIDAGCPVEPF